MRYINANIFVDDHFIRGGFTVENGIFTEVSENPDGAGEDLGGAYVIPGLIDIHNHGNSGADFSDGDDEGLRRMARYLAQNGVTSFAPASMTLPYDVLARAFSSAARLKAAAPAGCAHLMGIQMEGPFFSEKKKGAQNAAYLRLPDIGAFRSLQAGCGDLVRIVDVAPELPGAVEFTRAASEHCTVSVAHTAATYDEAAAVFDAGATHLTHLFNAMPPLHHRDPGPIGAAAERAGVRAELICDGIHVHPSAVRLAFRLFGRDRVCLISDALRCCGMPDGQYTLGGQDVFLAGGVARLADGTIAGSATNLYDCMVNAVRFGIAREDAILAATRNPARALGCADVCGAIAVGLRADFVVCDAALTRRKVYLAGNECK